MKHCSRCRFDMSSSHRLARRWHECHQSLPCMRRHRTPLSIHNAMKRIRNQAMFRPKHASSKHCIPQHRGPLHTLPDHGSEASSVSQNQSSNKHAHMLEVLCGASIQCTAQRARLAGMRPLATHAESRSALLAPKGGEHCINVQVQLPCVAFPLSGALVDGAGSSSLPASAAVHCCVGGDCAWNEKVRGMPRSGEQNTKYASNCLRPAQHLQDLELLNHFTKLANNIVTQAGP